MDDLTILYITANHLPQRWMEFQLGHLLEAIGTAPIISVSRKPMELGTNLLDTEKKCHWNIYSQMLRAARGAETAYVAMVEDDTLYSREHFTDFRPKLGEVSYNRSRWSLFCWDPIYCLRQRVSNCSLIAPRDYLVDCLAERNAKWPDGLPNERTGEVGRSQINHWMRVDHRMVEWYSEVPIIQLNHQQGSDPFARRKHKKHGQVKAIEIPFWGKSRDIAQVYYDGCDDSD